MSVFFEVTGKFAWDLGGQLPQLPSEVSPVTSERLWRNTVSLRARFGEQNSKKIQTTYIYELKPIASKNVGPEVDGVCPLPSYHNGDKRTSAPRARELTTGPVIRSFRGLNGDGLS